MKTSFPIVGMHCASCASLIEKKLKKTPGVTDASVNYGSEQAIVEGDDTVTPIVLSAAVSDIGYKAVFSDDPQSKDEAKKNELRVLQRKVIISTVLTILILLGSLPHMLGDLMTFLPGLVNSIVNPNTLAIDCILTLF